MSFGDVLTYEQAISDFADLAIKNKIKAFAKMEKDEIIQRIKYVVPGSASNNLQYFIPVEVFSNNIYKKLKRFPYRNAESMKQVIITGFNIKDIASRLFYEVVIEYFTRMGIHSSLTLDDLDEDINYFTKKYNIGDLPLTGPFEKVPSKFAGQVLPIHNLALEEEHNLLVCYSKQGVLMDISFYKGENFFPYAPGQEEAILKSLGY